VSEDLWEAHAHWWQDGFTEGADPEYEEQILPLAAQHLAGSHRVLERAGWPDYVFAFHDGEEIGPNMLKRIAKHTGLDLDDI
jgi:hypothetical protein